MQTYMTAVTHSNIRDGLVPRINLYGVWLYHAGFIPGALVQALPETNGIVFTLVDRDIACYSDLFHETTQKKGRLIRVVQTPSGPLLGISGKILRNANLHFPDSLLVECEEEGPVRVQKLPYRTRIVPLQLFKDKIRLSGLWLEQLGFEAGETILAEPGQDEVILRLQDGPKKSGMKMTSRNIDIKLDLFYQAGFVPGDEYLARFEYGMIKLRQYDARLPCLSQVHQ